MTELPSWKMIDEASRALTGRGTVPFTRDDVYREIWRHHPERGRGSLDPVFQGMIANAPGGPASAGGTPLRRVERGLYVRRSTTNPEHALVAGSPPAAPADGARDEQTDAVEDVAAGIDWDQVWAGVVRRLRAHVEAGRLHLLTEDAVRLCTVFALEDAGVSASSMAVEVPDPALSGGKLDLVVGDEPTRRIVIELKFPRDARGPISPDTMTLGELLRDFHRVARVDAGRRWVVQVIDDRLLRYLERVAERHPLVWVSEAGGRFVISGAVVGALPKTALDALRTWDVEVDVEADCRFSERVSDDLRLIAYEVVALPP